MEPTEPAPVATFPDAVKRRAGSLKPYQIAASDFDVSFITPILNFAAQSRSVEFGDDAVEPGRVSHGAAQLHLGALRLRLRTRYARGPLRFERPQALLLFRLVLARGDQLTLQGDQPRSFVAHVGLQLLRALQERTVTQRHDAQILVPCDEFAK